MNIENLVQSIQPRVAVDAAKAPSAKPAAAEPAAPAPAEAAPRASTPSFDAVKAAAAQIDSYLKSVGRNLDIHVDQDTGRTVVKVRDAATGDVIRQIPSEEALRLARSLGESGAALVNMTA